MSRTDVRSTTTSGILHWSTEHKHMFLPLIHQGVSVYERQYMNI